MSRPSPLDRLLDRVSFALAAFGAVLVVLMAVHIVTDIVSRALFRISLELTSEIVARYYMTAIVFLPLAVVEQRGAHIIAETFTDPLPPRALLFLQGAIGIVVALFAGLVAWLSLTEAVTKTAANELLQSAHATIPIWPTRWFLPVGFGLFCLTAALRGVRRILAAVQARAE